MILSVFSNRKTNQEEADQKLIELLHELEEIQSKLSASKLKAFSFKELAREQTNIVNALESSDPRMNKAAKELFL